MPVSRLLGAGALCLSASAVAASSDKLDDRFYFSPMVSHGFFETEDLGGQSVDPDDEFGGTLAIGRPLNHWFNLEGYAFLFDGVGFEDNDAEVDIEGFGIDALLFPNRDDLPVFGILGLATGNYDLDGSVGGQSGGLDSDYLDVGVGFIAPLNHYGIALRGEYRWRRAEIQADNASNTRFNDHILSLGLQVPIGAAPARPEPRLAPEPEPAREAEPRDHDGDGVVDTRDECPGTPSGTEVEATGCPVDKAGPIVLKGVHFEFDSATLTADAERRLDNVVSALQASDEVEVRIEGHTDSLGRSEYNRQLSQDRAETVKAYLVERGITVERLSVRGFGESRPVAPNTRDDGSDNPAGRAENRRVELHVED